MRCDALQPPCRRYRDVLAHEGWTGCIQPDAGPDSITLREPDDSRADFAWCHACTDADSDGCHALDCDAVHGDTIGHTIDRRAVHGHTVDCDTLHSCTIDRGAVYCYAIHCDAQPDRKHYGQAWVRLFRWLWRERGSGYGPFADAAARRRAPPHRARPCRAWSYRSQQRPAKRRRALLQHLGVALDRFRRRTMRTEPLLHCSTTTPSISTPSTATPSTATPRHGTAGLRRVCAPRL